MKEREASTQFFFQTYKKSLQNTVELFLWVPVSGLLDTQGNKDSTSVCLFLVEWCFVMTDADVVFTDRFLFVVWSC